ncbi:hypothetical protein DFH29DRAFT_882915 [Suillus ampliporus]|nr:hypothetical protein DFH29DRAFT_882915 [Suillus ampliporus]
MSHILHHVQEKHWHLSVNWNVEDSVTNVFHDIDVEWRLNRECTNSECPHCFTVMSQNFECAGASNRDDVKFLPSEIRYHKPPFIQLIKGIFYGGQCHRPFLVPIPVKDGINSPPTLDDLDINYWVKQYELYELNMTKQDQLIANFLIFECFALPYPNRLRDNLEIGKLFSPDRATE